VGTIVVVATGAEVDTAITAASVDVDAGTVCGCVVAVGVAIVSNEPK
jgi:hypothetical protein